MTPCTWCRKPVSKNGMAVHDPNGPSGVFCDIEHYLAARSGMTPVEKKLLHADLESVLHWEQRTLEAIAP